MKADVAHERYASRLVSKRVWVCLKTTVTPQDVPQDGLTKSRPHTTAQSDDHDCTQSIGLVVRSCWSLVEYDRKQSTGVLWSGPRTHPGTPCQGRLVLVNTRRPCPCLLDRGTTAVSQRLVSVVPCSTRHEANSNLLLMFFSLSFIFKLLATRVLHNPTPWRTDSMTMLYAVNCLYVHLQKT